MDSDLSENKKTTSDCSDENLRGSFDDGVPNYLLKRKITWGRIRMEKARTPKRHLLNVHICTFWSDSASGSTDDVVQTTSPDFLP